MRIPSGVTDQFLYFVAVDATDLKTRETGLATFTVYRSRDGAVAAAFTTPTINETDSVNMPGVYELLLDEDMTIAAGNDSEEVCLHITHAGMAPVTRVYELYRSKITAGETVTAANGAVDADVERLQGALIATPTVAGVLEVDVTHWIGTAAATPTVAGVPEVDLTNYLGAAAPALVGGRFDSSTGAMAANVLTAAAINADAITAAKVAADVSAEIADAVLDEDMTAHQTLGTLGQAIGDPVADTNTIYKAVVTDATGATVGVDVVAAKADTAAILADTGTDGVVVAAGSKSGYSLAADQSAVTIGVVNALAAAAVGAGDIAAAALNEIADALLDRIMSTGTDSGADNTTARTVRQALRALRNRVAVVAGTATIYKEDDVTASFTAAVTTAAGNPISETNPP